MSHRAAVFAVTSLGVFTVYLDGTIVNIAFPAIRATFAGVSTAQLSWVLNAYSLVFAALLLAAGQWADRLGRRRVFFTGLLVFNLGSVLCGLAPSAGALIGARVLQAIGAAMLGPSSLALLLDATPLSGRSTAVGLYGAVAALAVAVGPSLGSVIVEDASWRWAFLINIPVGLVSWLSGRRVLAESRDTAAQGRPDALGAVLLIAGIGALSLAIVQGNDWGWRDPRVAGAFGLAALAVPLCVWRTRTHPVAVVDPSLFRVRSFVVANAATVLFTAAFFGGLLANVLFLTTVWRYGLIQAGLALTAAPVCAALAGAAVARLPRRYGHRAIIVPGVLFFVSGLVLFLLRLGLESSFLAVWLPANILLGLGVGLALPTLSSATMVGLPPARLAAGSAVFSTARQLGAVIGVALLIAILDAQVPGNPVVSFDRAYILCLVLAAASGLVALALGRTASEAHAAQNAPERQAVRVDGSRWEGQVGLA
jgi:EmrB/QacA subfamily drug resistance transporter